MSKRLWSSFTPYICRQCQARLTRPTIKNPNTLWHSFQRRLASSGNNVIVEKRIEALGGVNGIHRYYADVPRRERERVLSASSFAKLYNHSEAWREPWTNLESIMVYGRVTSQRIISKKLVFITIATSKVSAGALDESQIILEAKSISREELELGDGAPREFARKLQRGDWIAARGTPRIPNSGPMSLTAIELPRIIAPALQTVPLDITDEEFRMHNRHADQIVHPSARDIIYLRHEVTSTFREFFNKRDFVEVTTPLLQANAGGAAARPFETVASEFSRLKLNLRVAPELYLKRLIVGGMPRVYEIGPAFRNEGVDATHNPEFSICEFYGVMMNLDELMRLTESLFLRLARMAVYAKQNNGLLSIPLPDIAFYEGPYKILEFIPALADAVRLEEPTWKFPDLEGPNAFTYLMNTFQILKISPPENPTIPALLDALAGEVLEPQCQEPTFIINQPECMSPLARSFSKMFLQENKNVLFRVSARAELYIKQREYVNCYEEENSPIEQRRKFEDQLKHRHAGQQGETYGVIDENYLSTLEWGMPPTGGWGCGIDRILMLFAGKHRIADVLPFGTLRNVVALGSAEARGMARDSVAPTKPHEVYKDTFAKLESLIDADAKHELLDEASTPERLVKAPSMRTRGAIPRGMPERGARQRVYRSPRRATVLKAVSSFRRSRGRQGSGRRR